MVTSLRFEDILYGATNFRSWKTRMLFILEENEIEYYVKTLGLKPKDDEEKYRHNKNEDKDKRILVDLVKYHFISHIS